MLASNAAPPARVHRRRGSPSRRAHAPGIRACVAHAPARAPRAPPAWPPPRAADDAVYPPVERLLRGYAGAQGITAARACCLAPRCLATCCLATCCLATCRLAPRPVAQTTARGQRGVPGQVGARGGVAPSRPREGAPSASTRHPRAVAAVGAVTACGHKVVHDRLQRTRPLLQIALCESCVSDILGSLRSG